MSGWRFAAAWLVLGLIAGVLVAQFFRLSLTPQWLQAVGGLGAFGVTAWLAQLTQRYVDAAERMAAAGRENQVAIARALLVDARRIRTELGPLPQSGTAAALPERTVTRVHPWLHPVIPQIALSEAGVVEALMTLDRGLDEFESALASFHSACLQRDQAAQTLEGNAGEARRRGVARLEEHEGYRAATQVAQGAERAVGIERQRVESAWRACDAELNKLDALLKPITGV